MVVVVVVWWWCSWSASDSDSVWSDGWLAERLVVLGLLVLHEFRTRPRRGFDGTFCLIAVAFFARG